MKNATKIDLARMCDMEQFYKQGIRASSFNITLELLFFLDDDILIKVMACIDKYAHKSYERVGETNSYG